MIGGAPAAAALAIRPRRSPKRHEPMTEILAVKSNRFSAFLFLVSTLAPVLPPSAVAGGSSQTVLAPAAVYQRVEIPSPDPQHPFPYTLEIPPEWKVQTGPEFPAAWLAPEGVDPRSASRLVYVRISPVALSDPEAVATNIRANDEKSADWKAPVVEVREVGGVRGLLVEMVRGEGTGAMTSLTLKLPVGEGSADFIGTAPTSEFAAVRPLVERILFSIQPRAEGKKSEP